MFFELSLFLIAMENGIVIPNAVWWLFGIDVFCRIVKAFIDANKK